MALSERDGEGDENPYLHRAARVFGPRPGHYGVGMRLAGGCLYRANRAMLPAKPGWLLRPGLSAADGEMRPDRAGIEKRLAAADAFVHTQDLPETDLLLAADYAAHEAGVAAAAAASARPLTRSITSTPRAPTTPRARRADRGNIARGALRAPPIPRGSPA